MGLRQQYRHLEECWEAAEHLDRLMRSGADAATVTAAQKALDEAQARAPWWSR